MSTLTVEQITAAFHSITRDSVSQAFAEGLLTEEEIETADVDVQIAGPSLALYFAALGSRDVGGAPSISSPAGDFALTSQNCPPDFQQAFTLWQAAVEPIKSLPSAARFDLALLLCDKPSLSSPLRRDVAKLSGDLKGIALEILQRRSFQELFQRDLDAALNSAVRPRTSGESSRHTAYEAPPLYSEGEPTDETKAAHQNLREDSPEQNVGAVVPLEQKENLNVIRETLYSALADSLVETPALLSRLARGPQWAPAVFFAATCLAIFEVALTRMDAEGVHTVNLGYGSPRVITASDTPPYLRPFLSRLVEVSQTVKQLAEEDDVRAVQEASEGVEQLSPPKLDRLKERLANGVGAEETMESSSSSVDNQVAQLANAINALALAMSSLPAFRERQADAFKVVASVTQL